MGKRITTTYPRIDVKPGMSIQQMLRQSKSGIAAICETAPKVPDDALMFQLKDIAAVQNPIAKLTRMIIYRMRLTEDMFYERHRKYKESIGKTPSQINTDKGNLKKTIMTPRITIKQFESIMSVLNYDIDDMVFVIKDRDNGKVEEFSLSDLDKIGAPRASRSFVNDDLTVDDDDE